MAVFCDSCSWGSVLFLTSLVVLIYLYFKRNKDYWKKKGIPTPTIANDWGRTLFRRHQFQYDQEYYMNLRNSGKDCGFGGFFEFAQPILMIYEPDLLRSILVKDFDHFVNRRSFDMARSDPIVNKMITNITDQEWKDLRSLMSPTFTSGKLKRIFQAIDQCGLQMEEYLRDKAADGEVVEMHDCFGRFSMDVIASSAFAVQCDSFKNPDATFPKKAAELHHIDIFRIVKIILAFTVPKMMQAFKISFVPKKIIDFFEEVVRTSMKHRKEDKGPKRNDFLQLLLEAQKGELKEDEAEAIDQYDVDAQLGKHLPSRAVLTDEVVIAQSILFFFAGYATTASLLSFVAYQLALNPDIQEKVVEELDKVLSKNNGEVSYEALKEMEYMDMVIMETLRMHPPAVRLERKCNKDYIIPGTNTVIENGMTVAVPIYAIHHDPQYYPNPSKFDPERFSPKEKSKRHPYAFMPFGHGPRNCIGMRFALMEAKVALVELLRHFSVEPCEKTAVPLVFDTKNIFLKSKTGIWLQVKQRVPMEEVTHL